MKEKDEEMELDLVDPFVERMFMEEARQAEKQHSLSYIPSFFTTASLPFKNVHKTVFVRRGTNGVTLTLSSPKNVPFGKYGRLLLSVLTTHAVLSKEKGVSVNIEYTSMADLLRELQLPKQRGSDIREQLECFSNAAFIFDMRVKELKSPYLFKEIYGEGEYPKKDVTVTTYSTGNIRFTNGVQFKEFDDGSADLKYGYFKIILSPEFSHFCQNHAVPIDYSVYKEITSPVGKDIYAWLVYRNNAPIDAEKGLWIPRDRLVEQFMPLNEELGKLQQAKLESNNYNKIIGLIRDIKKNYYPDLKVDLDSQSGGITLYKSRTPVVKDDTRYALITSNI